MLNGIEVLNTIEIYNNVYNQNVHNVFVMIAIASVIIFIIGVIGTYISNGDDFFFICVVWGVVCLMLSFGVISINSCITTKQPSGIIQYQVTISDNVSMVEFNEKYEVISVDGKIWTIVEKEIE